MGDKAGAAEGSSIFESLFGGLSNGLSIFTNNPFRRKQEVSATKVQGDSKKFGKDGTEQAHAEDTGGTKMEETVTDVCSHKNPTELGIELKSQRKHKHLNDDRGYTGSEVQGEGDIELHDVRLKKVTRDEDVSSEKKKRRRMGVVDENVDKDVNADSDRTGSGDTRKRKQESPAGSVQESVKMEVEETGNAEGKQSKKKKKRTCDWDSQTVTVTSQSDRSQKKRPNEETAEGQENDFRSESSSGKKERKIGIGVQEGGRVEGDTAVNPKRSLDMGLVEKRKKKMKLVNEVNELSPRVSDTAEKPQKSGERSSQLKAGSKRKTEDELERTYEKKMRGSPNSKENGGVADIDANLKGKRKVVDDDDDDFLGGKGKKRRLTKQQKIDNEAKLRRTVFVGNIPLNLKAKHLITELSQYGAVESARLRSVPIVDVKMPRKAAVITGNLNENRTSLNGYVVFKEEASAKAALAHNMKEFRGKHLRVDLAGSGSSGIEYDRKRSIFVGNLPFDAEDEDLITLFQGSTPELELEAVRVVRDPQTSAGKGFAFLCFKTKLGAEAALDKKEFIMFKDRHLRLERFGYKAASQKPRAKRVTVGSSGPQPGAAHDLSKRNAPASYEGGRAGKRKGVTLKSRQRVVSPTPNKPGRPKRPAVAAKKARALQMKAGGSSGPKGSGGKRKRAEEGKKKDSQGKSRQSKK